MVVRPFRKRCENKLAIPFFTPSQRQVRSTVFKASSDFYYPTGSDLGDAMKKSNLSVKVPNTKLDYQVTRSTSDPPLIRAKSAGNPGRHCPSPLQGDVSPTGQALGLGIERPESLVWALNENHNTHKPRKPGPNDFHLPRSNLATFQDAQPPVTSLAPKAAGRSKHQSPQQKRSGSKRSAHGNNEGPWEDISLFENGPQHKAAAVPQRPGKAAHPLRSHRQAHNDTYRHAGHTEKGLQPFISSTGAVMQSHPPKKPKGWVIFLVAVLILVGFAGLLAAILAAKR